MQFEAKSEQTLVSSQVFKWRLELTKEMWNSSDDIVLKIGSVLPGSTQMFTALKLVSVVGDVPNERSVSFITELLKNLSEEYKYEVSVKVKDKSNRIVYSTFLSELNLWDKAEGGETFLLEILESAESISFKEILNIEAAVTVLAEGRTQDLVPRTFNDNIIEHNDHEFFKATSDVDIICKGEIFPCHKYILCSQCPTFKSFLLCDCKESGENAIEIEDSTPEAVNFMVAYLYGYDLDELKLNNLNLDVLHLAEKYALIPLKKKCGESILQHLSVENFFVNFTEINRYLVDEPEFKEQAMAFFRTNAKEIAKNKDDWMKLIKDFPNDSYELMNGLASAFVNS